MTTLLPSTPVDRLAVMSSEVASLALPLLATTQAAALACRPFIGRGDSKAADGAAVAELRAALARVPGNVRVVIGEGEKDDAPMLYAGEEMGTGDGPACDLAVDPLEGTKLCARGEDGAVSVLAAAAAAVGKTVDEVAVAIQDRPRHSEMVAAVRATGAAVVLFADGDVMASLRVLLPGGDVDMLIGVGGAPEGVITACATRALGGGMQGRLAPQSAAEQARLEEVGVKMDQILNIDDLVADDDYVFVATAVTGSTMLGRPELGPGGWWTTSLVSTPDHPAMIIRGRVGGPAS
ncbi:MAG: fructose-bisphosphatase class II [Acidimicrobiia bacterium]